MPEKNVESDGAQPKVDLKITSANVKSAWQYDLKTTTTGGKPKKTTGVAKTYYSLMQDVKEAMFQQGIDVQ